MAVTRLEKGIWIIWDREDADNGIFGNGLEPVKELRPSMPDVGGNKAENVARAGLASNCDF